MLKKTLVVAALVVTLGLVAALWLLWGRTVVVELGPAELQRALERGFPVEKTYLVVIKLELSEPTVALQESSDRIGLAAKVRVGFLDTRATIRGTVEVSCRVRYDAARGAFFADDPRVERLSIEGHPKSYLEKTTGAVTWILRGVFENTPVYTLRAGDTRHSFAKLLLKDVRVTHGTLRLTLGLGT
ncbi:MAG TPA: DUF1439 domain-containing protein [Planctomycetota bacterium]|nr:DUF1439 domain-containing protein [Planctomycetota bacterium]